MMDNLSNLKRVLLLIFEAEATLPNTKAGIHSIHYECYNSISMGMRVLNLNIHADHLYQNRKQYYLNLTKIIFINCDQQER